MKLFILATFMMSLFSSTAFSAPNKILCKVKEPCLHAFELGYCLDIDKNRRSSAVSIFPSSNYQAIIKLEHNPLEPSELYRPQIADLLLTNGYTTGGKIIVSNESINSKLEIYSFQSGLYSGTLTLENDFDFLIDCHDHIVFVEPSTGHGNH